MWYIYVDGKYNLNVMYSYTYKKNQKLSNTFHNVLSILLHFNLCCKKTGFHVFLDESILINLLAPEFYI